MNSSCSALDMDAQGLYSLLRNIFKIRLIMFFMMADKKAKFIGIFANIPKVFHLHWTCWREAYKPVLLIVSYAHP